jgi:hypothetical protein
MSTVRTAILKLAALAAGGALIGGGAVHVAEKAAKGKPQYVKHAKKPVARVVHRAPPRPMPVSYRPVCPPGDTLIVIDKRTGTEYRAAPYPKSGPLDYVCEEPGRTATAALPLPPPADNPPPVEHRIVEREVLVDHGFPPYGGGFFGGFFGGSTGGVIIVPSTSSSTSGSTSGSTGGSTSTSTSGSTSGSTSTSSSTSTSTSTSGSTSGSTSTSSTSSGTPVPAPPMLVLFGAAAAALVGRRKLALGKAVA